MSHTSAPWWRSAVVYQVYIRSFADGDGDGTGDIAGLRSKLPYLKELGIDAIWINPWYPSPMADSGYDVADYRDIEPLFGDLDQADALLAEAHDLGLKVILDIVPNHSSDEHELFQAALAAGPGSPERAMYVFRDGDERPNDWESNFGGPAWTQVDDGQWYLHLFAPKQPDFDWNNPAVREEFEHTLRFWFDKGVDGFRIDVAHGLAKVAGLPAVGDLEWPQPVGSTEQHPHWDVDGVHEIWQQWRAVADRYDGDRTFVAEAWTSDPDRLALYLRPDELHTAFNFDFLMASWRAADLRSTIDTTIRSQSAVGAPTTWVLANHDVIREVSRYARPQTGAYLRDPTDLADVPADFELGRRRARAAALLMLALPGGAYVYQGEELGLPEVEDIPGEARQDPTYFQTDGARLGRDGCRVPIPWSGDAAPFGFSPDGATGSPWLPQPEWFAGMTAADQDGAAGSMLELYRAALALRHAEAALGDGELRWADAPADVLWFERDPGFACVVNLGEASVPLPDGTEVLLASGDLTDGALPSDTAAWIRR